MHRNKTFARIFLIFSIANVTVVLAAPALIRQRHFVTERADDEPTGDSKQDPAGLVREEVEPAATPPPVGSPEKSLTPSESWSEKQLIDYLANDHLSGDPERTVLPSSPFWHQDSSSPEQDPAGFVQEEVEPAATPPPVGSPEKSLTPSGLWFDKELLDHLAHFSGDPERTVLPSSPFREPISPELLNEKSPWLLQKASGSPELLKPSGNTGLLKTSGSPGLLEDEPQWWKTWKRPPSKWEQGESSHTASHGQMLPPASVAQPSHDDWRPRPYSSYEVGESSYTASHGQMLPPASVAQPSHDDWRPYSPYEVLESSYTASHGQMFPPASVAQPMHESDSDTDMDRASMMSWSSRVSGWAKEEAKDAEEVHPHL